MTLCHLQFVDAPKSSLQKFQNHSNQSIYQSINYNMLSLQMKQRRNRFGLVTCSAELLPLAPPSSSSLRPWLSSFPRSQPVNTSLASVSVGRYLSQPVRPHPLVTCGKVHDGCSTDSTGVRCRNIWNQNRSLFCNVTFSSLRFKELYLSRHVFKGGEMLVGQNPTWLCIQAIKKV